MVSPISSDVRSHTMIRFAFLQELLARKLGRVAKVILIAKQWQEVLRNLVKLILMLKETVHHPDTL